ncbi:GntR family transcriptional regulator [Rahnella aquatilis]|uniref:Transcriptional regulator n=1 Tax=Rahnella aquatilis (strain ATCC 33071 / DSM 4594 / JCM 1683 / NBRC 105701 / NCIMB 13365 / CIP 78.65) TaxID=745277 RepID=H2ISC9_RAHAC|nr:GntR family transcriptional regulator [Rahnella aquatilis]AEX51509.1 transcriptional regulator [Rahnella aquatilis CIP 78.65 = ATCC 33071]KFD16969.1 GntR family transcriptional regulator [Rahnella aquatilis CIP 78.65 = ATCC 33071]
MTTSPASLFQLDASNGMPLYMQLINSVKSAIARHELQPGDAIPSERDLVESLNIARGTIRKAFQQLLEEGILIRNQGSGTFVAPHVRQSLPLLESFSEMADASGGKAQSELVGYLRRASTPKEREILRLADEQKEVVELTRLRKINGIAVSLQTAILPAHLLDKINELDESLYLYLEKKGSPVLRASQHFKAVMTDNKLAYYLGIKEHHPLLLVTRTGYTYHEQPVEYTCTWCLNDYYDFTIELRLPQK